MISKDQNDTILCIKLKDAENADRNNDTKWWMPTPKVLIDSYYLMWKQGLSSIR